VPTFSSIKVPIKQRDGRSYKEVVNEKPVRNVTYQTSEEDREWLSRSLVGLISNGTDYAKIKKKMLMTLHNMEGFRFLGASKAILTFKTQQDMQLVADEEKEFWGQYFEDLRPWCITDKASDIFSWILISGLPIVAWNMECIKRLVGGDCKVLGYDLTSVSKGAISGLTILIGKPPMVSINGTVNLTIDKEKVEINISEIKYEACMDLASLIYSIGVNQEFDSELDCTSSPSDLEIVATKEQPYMSANKNSSFTDLAYVTEVIMMQCFSRCEAEKERDAHGFEVQVYFPEILDDYMIHDMTAGGKWQTSTPTISNIPCADKEKGTANMSAMEEDQQSWPTSNLGRSMTLRNGKQIGTTKCYKGHKKAAISTESSSSAGNEDSIDSCIRAVNQRLQLSQPPPDLSTACDEVGAMKEIGQKLGIEIGTTGESIEVMIKEAIDAEQDHWDRYVQ